MNLKNKALVSVFSAALLSATMLWEGGYVATPYDDIVNVLTVCAGHTGNDIVRGKKYTEAECKKFLENDLKAHRDAVYKCVDVPLTSYEFDAYTLFTYNVGASAFCSSTSVLKKLNAGDHEGACNGLLKWSYANGKYVQGLNNRRQHERKICLGQGYAK